MSRIYGNRSSNVGDRNYMRNLMTHISTGYERRRAQDRALYTTGVEVKQVPALHVEVTEFYPVDNAQEHNTDRFEIIRDSPASPVFRRGQLFYMAVRFDHPYDQNQDVIRLIFDYGPKPSVAKGTRQYLTMKQYREFNPDKNKWSLHLHNADGTTLTLQVFIPVAAQVGIWHCTVLTSRNDLDGCLPAEYKCPHDIYILFNPWCKDDLVYVEDDSWKEEYVLNDTGKVWMGSYRQPKGRRWIFGQYDDVVLPATMYLLELSDLPHSDRGNPILMVRAISAIINSLDEEGLMEGKWEGDFSDGISPHAWTGSVAIMEKYLQDGGTPVKYGQCWVFSGLVVTVCRALGIPCRSVTNYVSAHDTNCSLTIDKYFDHNGEEIVGGPDGECYDSCWNFHVWNDVWMSRPDLPPGYGGWQVIDATPQEESGSLYRCGPASVEAVRKGKVGFSYDTPFVFAEVNADVCHFKESSNSDWGFTRLQLNQYHVGRKIVTKMIGKTDDQGDSDMEDVTLLYKNHEGSQDERLAVYNAVSGIETSRKFYSLPKKEIEDVSFDLVEIDHVAFGEPFDVTVHIQNKSDKQRKVSAILSASSVYYTGATVHRLKRGQADFVLQPLQQETLKIKVKPEEYIDKLVNHSLIKIYAIATVIDTNQTWSEEDDFPLLKPKLSIEVHGNLKVGQVCHVTLSFQNPLNISLTDCSFSVEGFGLQRPKMMIRYRDIQPNELVSFTEYFHPKLTGERTIVGTFTSKQLSEVTGSTTFCIQE